MQFAASKQREVGAMGFAEWLFLGSRQWRLGASTVRFWIRRISHQLAVGEVENRSGP